MKPILSLFLYYHTFMENSVGSMNDDLNKDNRYVPIEIFENIIVIYIDGTREYYDAVQVTGNLVIIGRIINQNEFLPSGRIPKNSIQHIEGGKKKIVLRKSAD